MKIYHMISYQFDPSRLISFEQVLNQFWHSFGLVISLAGSSVSLQLQMLGDETYTKTVTLTVEYNVVRFI